MRQPFLNSVIDDWFDFDAIRYIFAGFYFRNFSWLRQFRSHVFLKRRLADGYYRFG